MSEIDISAASRFQTGNQLAKKSEDQLSKTKEAFRMRERAAKAKAQKAALKEKREEFESNIRSEDFAEQQKFLKSCKAAVDLLLACDSFLLWSLFPSESKKLEIPVPTSVTSENIDDAYLHVANFALEYEHEQSRFQDLENIWEHMLRMELLLGITVPYQLPRNSETKIWVHISPGFADLYKQYCKQLNKTLPVFSQTKPASVPEVPSTTVEDLEDRVLTRMKALDKGYDLGVGHVDWDLMAEADAEALAYKFQAFRGPVPPKPTAVTPALVSAQETPEPVTRIGDIEINSIVRQRGGSAVLKVIGFQEQFARCEFEDSSGAIVSNLLIPVASLEKVSE